MKVIDVTKASLEDLVNAAYDLSVPVGMGLMHFREGGLTDAEVRKIIAKKTGSERLVVYMDYVNGRCCKFRVFEKDGKRYIPGEWFDHCHTHVQELLRRCGVDFDVQDIEW